MPDVEAPLLGKEILHLRIRLPHGFSEVKTLGIRRSSVGLEKIQLLFAVRNTLQPTHATQVESLAKTMNPYLGLQSIVPSLCDMLLVLEISIDKFPVDSSACRNVIIFVDSIESLKSSPFQSRRY